MPGGRGRRGQHGGVRARLRGRGDDGLLLVLLLVVAWCAVMYLHVWRRHDRYGTFDNDLGFHDNYVWLIARGRSFSNVLGLPAFGHNATFGYFLLAPLSWIGLAGPQVLNLLNTVAVGVGAVPLYLLARDRFGDPWKAVPFALLWLLHPVVQGNAWETFHPDAFAMAPLLAASLCATRQRWRWFAAFLVLALVWKSDVALAVVVLGVLVAVRWHRRVGLAAVAAGVLWFAVTVGWMIPHLAGGETVFGELYGDLGDNPIDVAATAVRDPTDVVDRVVDNRPVRYSRDLLAPYGFVPVLGGAPLAIALPQATVNLLSERPFTHEWRDNPHYQAIPMVAIALALVEGAALLQRRKGDRWRVGAVSVALAGSLGATVAWGSLPPLTTQFAHYWSADHDPARDAKDRAIAIVPGDAVVTAHYLLVPHLTHRESVFSFPNPWRRQFYGVQGDTRRPDPAQVEHLAMLTDLLVGPDLDLWNCILGSGAFEVVLDEAGVVVARRIEGETADRSCG